MGGGGLVLNEETFFSNPHSQLIFYLKVLLKFAGDTKSGPIFDFLNSDAG